jgi:hypothetical protein
MTYWVPLSYISGETPIFQLLQLQNYNIEVGTLVGSISFVFITNFQFHDAYAIMVDSRKEQEYAN